MTGNPETLKRFQFPLKCKRWILPLNYNYNYDPIISTIHLKSALYLLLTLKENVKALQNELTKEAINNNKKN